MASFDDWRVPPRTKSLTTGMRTSLIPSSLPTSLYAMACSIFNSGSCHTNRRTNAPLSSSETRWTTKSSDALTG